MYTALPSPWCLILFAILDVHSFTLYMVFDTIWFMIHLVIYFCEICLTNMVTLALCHRCLVTKRVTLTTKYRDNYGIVILRLTLIPHIYN